METQPIDYAAAKMWLGKWVYFLKQLIDFLTISGKTVLKPQ
jgi:hypothetical protein